MSSMRMRTTFGFALPRAAGCAAAWEKSEDARKRPISALLRCRRTMSRSSLGESALALMLLEISYTPLRVLDDLWISRPGVANEGFVSLQRFLPSSEVLVEKCLICVGRSACRIQLDSSLEVCQCFWKQPLIDVNGSAVDIEIGIQWLQINRAIEIIQRAVEIAHVKEGDSAVEKRRRTVRVQGDGMTVILDRQFKLAQLDSSTAAETEGFIVSWT